MAQVKISELTELTDLANNDVLPIVDTSATSTKKVGIETLKNFVLDGVDLNEYVKNTDYASNSVGGVIKVNPTYANTYMSASGTLLCADHTYEAYDNKSKNVFISKGTLDNVLDAKIGNIDSVLDSINGEVI